MAYPIMTIVFDGDDASCTVETPISAEVISRLDKIVDIYKQQIEAEKGVVTTIKSIHIEMNGSEIKE